MLDLRNQYFPNSLFLGAYVYNTSACEMFVEKFSYKLKSRGAEICYFFKSVSTFPFLYLVFALARDLNLLKHHKEARMSSR